MNYASTSPEGHYTVAIVAASATSYNMTATPVTGGAQEGDACGTFALDETGEDTGGTYASGDCWGR
jgi:type IV pilus assembly protein PilE